jgi:hypothetical protein
MELSKQNCRIRLRYGAIIGYAGNSGQRSANIERFRCAVRLYRTHRKSMQLSRSPGRHARGTADLLIQLRGLAGVAEI